MDWEPWPKKNEKDLARYASPTTGSEIRLQSPTAGLMAAAEREAVVRELYEAFAGMDLRWSRPLYQPDDALQLIRTPASIMRGAGDATCLDLALLFAGAALGKDLLPLVIVLEGHALVAVSLAFERAKADHGARRHDDGAWIDDGVLPAAEAQRVLIESGNYVLIECTGFARDTGALDPQTPEGQGRVGERMPYERAREAGREQLAMKNRPFLFAIDIATLQDVYKLKPYDSASETVNPDLRLRLSKLRQEHDLVAGRDEELDRLDLFGDSPPGYCLVTGDAGSGKTTLLNGWIRRQEERGTRVVYQFVNRQWGTADNEHDFLQGLLQQMYSAWGTSQRADGSRLEMESEWLKVLDVHNSPPTPVVIVIDGIDEAREWSIRRGFFPTPLPPAVHVVVSARAVAGRDWLEELGIEGATVITLEPLTDNAVVQFIHEAKAPEWLLEPEAFAELTSKAQGDVFYLHLLCKEVAAGKVTSISDLRKLEKGLDNFFGAWWREIESEAAQQPVEDLLSYLTVARAPITRHELIDIDDNDALRGINFGSSLARIDRYVTGDPGELGLSLAHWRLKDFLRREVFGESDLRKALERLLAWCDRWNEHHHHYAVTKVFGHRLDEMQKAVGQDRAAACTGLVHLICEPQFQEERVEKFEDVAGLIADLARMLDVVGNEAEVSVSNLVAISLEQSVARDRWLQPGSVFELAWMGRLDEAIRRLGLLSAQGSWRQAAMVAFAWIAADAGAADRYLPADLSDAREPLPLLGERVRHHMDPGYPEPALVLPYGAGALPSTSSVEMAREVVQRFGGSSAEGMVYSGLESINIHQGDEAPAYIAELESPVLAAAARDHAEGNTLLTEYIVLHSANPYADYRDRALWAILGSVACLPDPYQARRLLIQLAGGAFAPSPVRFADALPLSITARRLREGGPGPDLASWRHLDVELAAAITNERTSDRWSHHRRRLAAHAEEAAVSGDMVGAAEVLDLAIGLPLGFAGYQSPANLLLAESNLIARPGDLPSRQRAIDAALSGAHNVQEPSFCARTTAGVTAISEWWIRGPGDVEDLVDRFTRNPADKEFAAVHLVGDSFSRRDRSNHLPIDSVTFATTLEDLALRVYQLPVTSFEAVNPRIPRDLQLDVGTRVAVPDHGFLPLMATWLSAQVVAAGLDAETSARLLARLVPIASANPTLLDTVLARLVRVAPTVDLNHVEELSHLAHTNEPDSGDEYGLA
jgi:AAA ATPase-like protein